MSDDTIYVQAVALGLDPAWRRLPTGAQEADIVAMLDAETETTSLGIRTLTYSTVGLEPGVDILLFRLAPSVDALESAGARLARSGLGRWLTIRHSLLGLIGPSQYVRKPTSQERSVLDGEPAAYLVVYPFTKSTEWYLQSRDERQSIMNEHMRIGHRYPTVRQLLAYSFGLDDQDFVVAYDTDDLAAFGSLVRDLRGTESRRSTVRDTPLLLGVHRPLPELLGRLVARTAVVA
ncbi:MAG TPA: chlorite dismutase family protein [Candidatus Limnocylindrales bacterium]|nr:chlorite dismutase family protein [Candidatus Limnocylindrales bacterium]